MPIHYQIKSGLEKKSYGKNNAGEPPQSGKKRLHALEGASFREGGE